MKRENEGAPRNIAVIGAGIAGLGAAWLLSRRHRVTLFESAGRLGGHARTLVIELGGREVAVDTGFIVFNRVNYPNLCGLFDHLQVPTHKSDMSFAVSLDGGAVEYGFGKLKGLLAQPGNACKPGFWRMLRDITVFNRKAPAEASAQPDLTLGELLHRLRLGPWFRRYYLLPMSGAIWSTPRARMLDFPAAALVQFFANHGLLSLRSHHQWWTVTGGARNYVSALADSMTVDLRLRARVEAVTRTPDGARVQAVGQDAERFDAVVLACHTDTALDILQDPDAAERRVLGGIPYRRNKVVLHTDTRLMPRRRACWSSWVYLADAQAAGEWEDRASVTYWMNSLQGIARDTPLFASLNPPRPIDEARILDEHPFEHPVYDFGASAARAELPSIQGRAHIWYCGAWTGAGFHEDGLLSAVRVARDLGVSPPWE